MLGAALLLLHHPALLQGLEGADGRAALGRRGQQLRIEESDSVTQEYDTHLFLAALQDHIADPLLPCDHLAVVVLLGAGQEGEQEDREEPHHP